MGTYTSDVDIADLVQVEDVMDQMEFVRTNIEWLDKKLSDLDLSSYVIFDCPGQVELYTVDNNMKEIIEHLGRQDYRLTCVNLVDSHHCSDPTKFISVCLTSLTAMLQISLPHVNLLSKVDLVEKYGKLQFNLDFYTDVLDLEYILETLPDDNFP